MAPTPPATYGKTLSNGADVLLSASKYSTHGEKDLYFPEYNQGALNGNFFSNGETNALNNYGHAHDMDGGEDKHLFVKALYDDFTFTSGYVQQDHKAPADVNGNLFNDPLSHVTDSTTYGDLKYNTQLSSKTQLEMEGYSQWFKRSLFVPYDANYGFGPFEPNLQVNSAYGNWLGGEAKLVTTAFNRQKLVTGIEYQDDLRERLYATDTNACLGCYLYTSHGIRAGVYAQDDISLRDNLILSAGGRFDKHHMIKKGIEFNPILALVWNPQPDDTVKLLYGSAFRAPNVIEDSSAAGEREAEHVKNYQLVDEWRPAPGVKYTGSLFYNNYTQVMAQDPTTGVIVNNGRLRSYGYDLGAEKRWVGGASVNVSFDHTIMYDAQNIWAVNSPKNVAKARYGQPLFGDGDLAKLGMEVVYVGARRTLQPGMPNAAPYELVNANLASKKIIPGADVSFAVFDLLNEHPQFVGGNYNNLPPYAGYYAQNVLPLGSLTVEAMVQFKF